MTIAYQSAPTCAEAQRASASRIEALPSGVDVVVEGTPAHAFYAIVSGTVGVRRDGEVLAHRGPGESFGERGLLDSAPRNATVTTEADARLFIIDGGVLLEALEAAPNLTSALNRSPAGRGLVTPDEGPALIDDPRWREPDGAR